MTRSGSVRITLLPPFCERHRFGFSRVRRITLFGARRGSYGLLCRCIFRLWTRPGYRNRIVPSRRPSSGINAESEQNNLASTSISRNGRRYRSEAETQARERGSLNPRLARNADQPWFNYVPLPLNPNVLIDPLPLPKPKPDLVLWCSWDGSLQG